MKFVKSRLVQAHVGEFDFEAVNPMQGRTFDRKDWYNAPCEQIHDSILKEGNGFVSFMQ